MSMYNSIMRVVEKNPGKSSKEIAEMIAGANPNRVIESISRLHKKGVLKKIAKNPFRYVINDSIPENGKVAEMPGYRATEIMSEYLVFVRHGKHQYRKGYDNNVDLKEFLATLEEDDIIDIYRKVECQKKIIWTF